MDRNYENPYLPGVEPDEVADSKPETELAATEAANEGEQPLHEPITVGLIRTLVRNKEQGKYRPKELGVIDIYPNKDEKNRDVFGFWRTVGDGSIKFLALDPAEQEIAQKIAGDDEIIGYRNGTFIYENNDSQVW
ncbi:hypothetical protein IPM19_03100 [bacterium]|nr:MAG: hypothetical protein IPM19_03100 [bacterium]